VFQSTHLYNKLSFGKQENVEVFITSHISLSQKSEKSKITELLTCYFDYHHNDRTHYGLDKDTSAP